MSVGPTSLVPAGVDGRVGFINPMNDPEKAREMQVAKTATYRAKRREAQVNKKDAAMAALGPAAEAALGAIESDRLANKTNEELADMQVRRMARVVLLGGLPFVPTSLKEATESAHTWSAIAKNESLRKGKLKDEKPEDDTSVQRAAKDLQRLARHLTAVQKKGVG